jgi:hypothetical protein
MLLALTDLGFETRSSRNIRSISCSTNYNVDWGELCLRPEQSFVHASVMRERSAALPANAGRGAD